ncbi:putative bacteriophage-fragment (repressor 2) [Vibrio anguillarum]|nr:hypothetical protein VAA_03994 [Vibrio anguillarum 775]CDQ48316.1 putative bacteriophage-fragment (repressor 2) [Vibrio anguillarum]
MYQSQLLDAYKKAQNYIQDKQIAHDLNLPRQRIGEMRKGLRYISEYLMKKQFFSQSKQELTPSWLYSDATQTATKTQE